MALKSLAVALDAERNAMAWNDATKNCTPCPCCRALNRPSSCCRALNEKKTLWIHHPARRTKNVRNSHGVLAVNFRSFFHQAEKAVIVARRSVCDCVFVCQVHYYIVHLLILKFTYCPRWIVQLTNSLSVRPWNISWKISYNSESIFNNVIILLPSVSLLTTQHELFRGNTLK